MRFLFDTHAWLWLAIDHPKASRRAKETLRNLGDETVGLSPISFHEAAWHLSRGRIEFRGTTWSQWLRTLTSNPNIEVLPITPEIAIDAQHFPTDFSNDPADRIIAATARVHELVLLTADRAMRDCKFVETLW